MTLKARYDALSSQRRLQLLIGAVMIGVAAAGAGLYGARGAKKAEAAASAELGKVAFTDGLLEDTLTERVEGRVEKLEATNAELLSKVNEMVSAMNAERAKDAKKIREIEDDARAALDKIEAKGDSAAPAIDTAPKNELAELGAYRVGASYPQPPQLTTPTPPVGFRAADYEPPQPKVLGGISAMPPSAGFDASQKKTTGTGAATTTIFLPPGFMNARLLTGVDAAVSQNASGNPEPIIARVQAPAVLPNHVRANLQGCFVVGNATGSLAKERVEVRAVSLSCLDFQERAVIDEQVKGFFVDTDGKKGLSGRVVTRSGALLARSFMAGVLSGFGQAVEATSGTRAISPLGEVRSFNASDIAAAGAGGGVSKAAEDLSELYLELAREAGPIVEVGAGKDVVLVIQEGVELNVRRNVNVAQ
jgi:conjugal transfer pilus assembly protein TraB